MPIEIPNETPATGRFQYRRRLMIWAGVVVTCILLTVASIRFVKNARRDARASMMAHQFRHVILDMRSFSGHPLAYDGLAGGAMRDVVNEKGDRLLSWRVWLTDHSLPIPRS